ncbi:MAG: efflux RND transporter periplasmic adaptor subunit [Halioglobus sp.]
MRTVPLGPSSEEDVGTISTMGNAQGQDSSSITMPASGMDKPIKKKRFAVTPLRALILLALLGTGSWFTFMSPGGNSLTIAGSRLMLSVVSAGVFEDSIPVRARVAPLKTVYLDAIQGGRVEEILVEDGASVKPGQAIVRLSNSDLQLSVMSTESRIMEQLNSMRDQELRLEQNRLAHKRTLVEVDYQIRRLDRDIKRHQELLAKGHAAQSNYEDLIDEVSYFRARRAVTLESQASDERLMANQLAFFKDNTAVMEQNLTYARQSLQELDVSAPVAGKLSGFNMEIGQSISQGTRIGQVDNPDQFKLTANIDEFYLARVDIDQAVAFTRDGRSYQLRIAKIYPNVEKGQFEIDIQFMQETPPDLRRGETIQSKLTLGDANEALLIPNGSFFQDTGGQWIFVVSPDGNVAVRRTVKLGRRNKDFIEVLDGLEAGETVITSPYSGFRDMDQLVLNKKNTL